MNGRFYPPRAARRRSFSPSRSLKGFPIFTHPTLSTLPTMPPIRAVVLGAAPLPTPGVSTAWMALIAVLAVYAVMSIVTFGAYAVDKRAARRGGMRTRERTLHLLELFGGWPGALIAQRTLRHKTKDTRFRVIFVLIALAHVATWGVLGWYALRGRLHG